MSGAGRVNGGRTFPWVRKKHEVFEKLIWNGHVFQTSYLCAKYVSGSVESELEGSFSILKLGDIKIIGSKVKNNKIINNKIH